MTRSDRLLRLSSIVEVEEKARARRLEALAAEISHQSGQLDLLRRYRQETAEQLAVGRVGESFSVRALQDQQGYLAALDRAIGQGEQRRVQLQAELERLREAWRVVRRRVQGIDQVAERARCDEDRQIRRKEQVVLDDYPRRNAD